MDIVCISRSTWEGDYMKSNVHLMGQLASKHKVLYVDYVMTIKDIFTLLLSGKVDLKGDGDIVVIVSGRNVDASQFKQWIE